MGASHVTMLLDKEAIALYPLNLFAEIPQFPNL